MQGGIQKWVDHSISVTVNLPKETSKEVIANVFETAWKCGCKGITVYREGSRDGILISKEKKTEEKFEYTRRPKELEAEVIRFKNNKESWVAFVGLIDEKPYEIFTGLSNEDSLLIPKSVTKGKIIKIKNAIKGKSRYDFKYTDKFGYENTLGGLSHMFNQEYWNYAKLISSVLRHGMQIQHVVDLISSLELDSQSINTWKNGVERALKKYIPNGIVPKKGTKCENCGSEFLRYQEGCLICTACGTSKCG
jgi:ribonucleoside-diphosphate reductase alpha chain